jgi:hypothetical protein
MGRNNEAKTVGSILIYSLDFLQYIYPPQAQGWQKPGFKKKTQPGVFLGFYWVLLGFWGFLGFFKFSP